MSIMNSSRNDFIHDWNLQLSVESGKETLISDKNNCTRCDCSLTEGKVRRISCGHLVCRQCSIGTPTGDRVCTTCNKFQEAQQQTADWFYEQLKQRFFNKGTVAAAALSNSDGAQDGEVRDFMESIVEGLVGEGLDNVCLRPVSIHPNYKPLSHTDSPSFIHGELKELIKQIMRETSTLPSFHVFSNGSLEKSIDNEAGELEKKSYEDILATAILNKVVERHQQGLNKFVSNTQISVRDTNDNVVGRNIRRRRRRYKLTNKPIRDCRTQNSSSDSETNDHNFPNSCDDCNWSGSTKSDPLSFTVEECIEEVVTKYSSEDEPDTGIGKFLSSLDFKRRQRAPFPEFGMDIVDGRGSSPSSTADEDEEENDGLRRKEPNIHASMEMISQVDSWEENWLFQKKRLKTAGMNHSMPVPMLVPNPTEEYRVLIGEIDAEETSDLSECSDSALEDLLDGPGNNVSSVHSESEHELENTDAEDEFLMQLYKANKPLIHNGFSMQNGGVLESADLAEDCDETDCKTEICSEDIQFKSKNPVFNLNEAKNNELIVPQVDSGEGSLEIQQDSEYTEAYDSAAQLSVSKNDTGMSQTDTDRNTANDTKNSSEERRIEPEESTPDNTSSNGVDNQNQEDNDKANDSESENFDLFSAPPRPGTIAEREHKKWLQAVPLTNNPYSKENIERRQRERMLLRRQTSNETSVEFPELTGENNSSVVPIDCSGCKPNHKQYGRDYYINSSEQKEKRRDSSNDTRTDISTTHAYDGSKSQVSVRVEVEVGGRWSGAAPPATKSAVETRTHVSNLNNQQLLTTVSTSNSRDRQQVTTVSTWGTATSAAGDDDDDDDHIALPSVKELAKQFSNVETDPQPQVQATEILALSTPASRNKLDVQAQPIRQVHSLTARCISKEFREGLRASNRPADYMKPVEKAESCGNISDDSGTASPTPTGNQKLCNSIAFWEQINGSR